MIQPLHPNSADFPLVDQLVPKPSAARQAIFAAIFMALFLALTILPSESFASDFNDWRHLGQINGLSTQLNGPIGERTDTNLVPLPDGRVFQWGGRGKINDGTIYDPDSGEFEVLPMPDFAGRYAASTVVLNADEVFVWGGQTSGHEVFDFPETGVIYNISSKTWRETSSAPEGLMDAPAVLVDDKVLIAGGEPPSWPSSPASFLYSPADNTWTSIELDVEVAVLIETENRILAAGPIESEFGSPGVAQWQVVEYSPKTQTWDRRGSPTNAAWLIPISVNGQLRAITLDDLDQPIRAWQYDGKQWLKIRESAQAAEYMSLAYVPWQAETGETLYFGNIANFSAYDPSSNQFLTSPPGEQLRADGGSAVWTGEQLVSLSSSGTRGWQFDPD